LRERTAALLDRMGEGGMREAFVRAFVYVRQPQLAADERGFRMLQKLRDEHAKDVTLAQFKQLVRDQFMMVLLDPEEAIETLPKLLAGREAEAPRVFAVLDDLLAVGGPLTGEAAARRERVAGIFGAAPERAGRSAARRRLSVAGGSEAVG
jgi:hypothetical protein